MDSRAQAELERAKVKIAGGDYAGAKQLIEGSLNAHSDHPLIKEQLGLIAYQTGSIVEAKSCLSRAIELDPTLIDSRIALLRIASKDEDRAAAAGIAKEALSAGITSAHALTLAAKAFKRNREYARAGAVWRMVAAQQSNVEPMIEAAEAYLRAKDFNAAIACATDAALRDPASEHVKSLRLRALDSGRADPLLIGEAIQDLAAVNASAALAQLPTLIANGLHDIIAVLIAECKRQGISVDPVLLSSLTKSLQTVANRAESERNFEKSGRYWKSLLYIEAGNNEASRGLRSALAALSDQARDAKQAEQHSDAARLLRSMIALDDTNLRTWRDLASALEKAEDWVEAAAMWVRCIEINRDADRPTIALRIAKVARKVESIDHQLRLFVRAQGFDSTGIEIRDWGDKVYTRTLKAILADIEDESFEDAVDKILIARQWQGDKAKLAMHERKIISALRTRMGEADRREDASAAAKLAKLILAIDPARIQALKLAARFAYQQRQFKEAVDYYTRLTELEPTDERHYARLGRTYRSLRMYDKGIPVVKRLLELQPDHPQARLLLSEMLLGQQNQATSKKFS